MSSARPSEGGDAARSAGAPTGLVLEGRSHTDGTDDVGWRLKNEPCPVEGGIAFDRTTGEVAWSASCKSARCPSCSRRVSARTFALARRAADEATDLGEWVRFMTLTRAPDGWAATRKAVQDWLQHLRRRGYAMHVLWVVERGSENGMKHVHVIQRGDYVPKEELEASWPHGSTNVQAARQAVAEYLSKGVIRYVGKNLDGDGEAIEEHMNLNGGRAAHWSRGFFLGVGRDDFARAHPLPGIYFVEVAR